MEYEGNFYKYLKRENYRGYVIEYYTTDTSFISQFLVWIPLDDNKKFAERTFEDVQNFAKEEIDRLIAFRDGQDLLR